MPRTTISQRSRWLQPHPRPTMVLPTSRPIHCEWLCDSALELLMNQSRTFSVQRDHCHVHGRARSHDAIWWHAINCIQLHSCTVWTTIYESQSITVSVNREIRQYMQLSSTPRSRSHDAICGMQHIVRRVALCERSRIMLWHFLVQRVQEWIYHRSIIDLS